MQGEEEGNSVQEKKGSADMYCLKSFRRMLWAMGIVLLLPILLAPSALAERQQVEGYGSYFLMYSRHGVWPIYPFGTAQLCRQRASCSGDTLLYKEIAGRGLLVQLSFGCCSGHR